MAEVHKVGLSAKTFLASYSQNPFNPHPVVH